MQACKPFSKDAGVRDLHAFTHTGARIDAHLALCFVHAWDPLHHPVRQAMLQHAHVQCQRMQNRGCNPAYQFLNKQECDTYMHVYTQRETKIYLASLFMHAQERFRECNRREWLIVLWSTHVQHQRSEAGAQICYSPQTHASA